MGHSNGDIDSMGSSLGIYRLAKTLEKETNIVNNTYGMTLSKFIEELEKDDEYKDVLIGKNEALNKATNKTKWTSFKNDIIDRKESYLSTLIRLANMGDTSIQNKHTNNNVYTNYGFPFCKIECIR